MRVYLAGPITGSSYRDTTKWRDMLAATIRQLGHTPVSPLRGKDYLKDETNIKAVYEVEGHPMSTSKGIYGRDSFDVQHCDIVFANLLDSTEVSIGTAMEIQMGRDFDKYVLVIAPEGSIHDHPFIREAASLVVPDFDTAVNVLRALLGG